MSGSFRDSDKYSSEASYSRDKHRHRHSHVHSNDGHSYRGQERSERSSRTRDDPERKSARSFNSKYQSTQNKDDEDEDIRRRTIKSESRRRSLSPDRIQSTPNEFIHPSRRGLVDNSSTSRTISRERQQINEDEKSTVMRYEQINTEMRAKYPDSQVFKSKWSPRDERNLAGRRYRDGDHKPARTYDHSRDRDDQAHERSDEEPERPNFNQSGALLTDKLYKGVALQYVEPEESRKPDKRYRLYVFRKGEIIDDYTLDQQSAYLLGRDRTVVDIPLDHPSCSKQHAVLQYRMVVEEVGFLGEKQDRIGAFIYDLGSSNGTKLNKRKIEPKKYVEVKLNDMITFGTSSREYLLMCEDQVDE
ncbi:SMAD/FHA domain-containing protein [Lipomyces oligophaga]|uniref:SMAD/FHA domain-containing protein n=1 Tax=Lipomyces oligophaga TaxID=45792 RepID=UPI0034CE392B